MKALALLFVATLALPTAAALPPPSLPEPGPIIDCRIWELIEDTTGFDVAEICVEVDTPRPPVGEVPDDPEDLPPVGCYYTFPCPDPGYCNVNGVECTEATCELVATVVIGPGNTVPSDDCHTVVCNDGFYTLSAVQVLGVTVITVIEDVVGDLSALPGGARVENILTSTQWYCDDPDPNNPPAYPPDCQLVFWSPDADAGFRPLVVTNYDDVDGFVCGWGHAEPPGHTHVSWRDDFDAGVSDESCHTHLWVYVAFGADANEYHVDQDCSG